MTSDACWNSLSLQPHKTLHLIPTPKRRRCIPPDKVEDKLKQVQFQTSSSKVPSKTLKKNPMGDGRHRHLDSKTEGLESKRHTLDPQATCHKIAQVAQLSFILNEARQNMQNIRHSLTQRSRCLFDIQIRIHLKPRKVKPHV